MSTCQGYRDGDRDLGWLGCLLALVSAVLVVVGLVLLGRGIQGA